MGAAGSRWLPRADPDDDVAVAAPALRRGGTLKIAEVGEPLTLDVTVTTADLTATITLPVLEQLFAFDANWRYHPSLVSAYTVSKDGLTYTFTLRGDVPFHNGKTMTADDVVSSLNRWGRVNPRATPAVRNMESISAAGSDTVAFEKSPVAAMPVHVHLLVESGIHIIECLNLEELAADGVTEFLFVGAPMKIRGATGAPLRPLAVVEK